MAAKAVVRDVARVQGKAYGLADRLSKMIPFEVGMTLGKAVEAEEAPSERLPEPAARMIAGVAVPLLTLDLKQASAVAKVAVALQTL